MSDRDLQMHDEMTRRAYGLLATSMNEVLVEMRQALESHAGLLPKGRIGEVDALLAEFDRRRVRIALYGEVKAGKSSLLNAVAGAELSPVAFDPLTSIPVRVTYGSRTVWQVGSHRLENIAELTQLMRAGVRDASEVVIETNVDLLQLGGQVDLLDTPGVGSEERFDAISAEALRSLDAVVLVVRYPALYTQVTRRLMEGLKADIGKLFVVWNLDADCAELNDEERTREADKLRAEVAGAHELLLVDARAAFRARQAGDKAALAASGISALTDTLGRFASSDKRQVAALREAAKRAVQWIDDARGRLVERRRELEQRIGETRERLQKVQNAADTKTGAARAQFAEVQAAMTAAGQQRAAAMAANAETLHKALRGARRTWVRNGRITELETAIGAASDAYAEACAGPNRTAVEALREATKRMGTVISIPLPERPDVRPSSLAPLERIERALGGSARVLRRMIWKRWYLPGLTALERIGIGGDVAAQTAWFDRAASSAEQAARGVLDGRLAEIARTAQAELERIRVETNFLAEEAELAALEEHVPALAAQRERIEAIGKEARALV
jgi:tRNA U34 5-carboxymethylaminomethyl modifying GTPase MnmE/TrmE